MSDPREQTQFLTAPEIEAAEEPSTPVLVVVQGEEIGRRYLLNESRLILGRDPDYAQLVVVDPAVSGKHALIQVQPQVQRFGFVDLGSRNGTLLNGVRMESGALRDGDKLFVGQTILKFSLQDSIEDQFHSEIDRLMHIDALTGLFQRGWFDSEYPKAFDRAQSESQNLSVLMMDMDGLKAINDRHGHQMGSHCISEAGFIIKEHLTARGCGARFGGDEFVAYLPGQNQKQALELAEQIRGAIECHRFEKDDIQVEPTISIGVAELSSDLAGAEELSRRADAALYRAKRAGRNSVSS